MCLWCLIFQEFDSVYGNGWQCVVGSNFGCYFTHSSGTFIYFSLETLNFLIFKGTSWFVLCTIWDRIQGLVIREASTCRIGFWFIPFLFIWFWFHAAAEYLRWKNYVWMTDELSPSSWLWNGPFRPLWILICQCVYQSNYD